MDGKVGREGEVNDMHNAASPTLGQLAKKKK